jgi:hypothetical protein
MVDVETLKKWQAVVDAAKLYHKHYNPKAGGLAQIGTCSRCGLGIPSISDPYCRKCMWELLDEAFKALEGVE